MLIQEMEQQIRKWVERDILQFRWTAVAIFRGLKVEKDRGTLEFWTSKNRYTISFSPTYLGCIAVSRRWRAGEDWHRGNDLHDGPPTEETWSAILKDILSYELESPAEATSQNDLLEAAWGLIANAGNGDWSKETSEWREAANRWRDEYHEKP